MKKYFLLSSLILLAIFLRTYQIETMPVSVSEDEAAIGYNAYSILKTARDETGKILPLLFESFGDYKLPLPIYITVPFIGIFSVSELAVRLPAILFGIASVISLYILAKNLFNNVFAGIIAAGLLAISPWHLQISRFDTPVSMAILFYILLFYVLISNFNASRKLFYASVVVILLIVTHPATWFVGLPLLIGLVITTNKFQIRKYFNWRILILTFTVSLLIITLQPNWFNFYIKSAFFNELGFKNRINELRTYVRNDQTFQYSAILQNKYTAFSQQVVNNYLSGFDYYYLFSSEDFKEKNYIDQFGKFYSIELFFFFFGIYWMVKTNHQQLRLLMLGLLLAPLPGIFVLNPNFPQTLFFMIIPFYLITALGITIIIKFLTVNITLNMFKVLVLSILLMVFSLHAITFLHYYFDHYSLQTLNNWHYGYKQLSMKANQYHDYNKIIITDRTASKPYILLLFYQKIDPAYYHSIEKYRGGSNFIATTAFEKYQFRSIDWQKDQFLENTLLIGFNEEIQINNICVSENRNCKGLLEIIKLPDNKNEYRIYGL